MSEDYPRPSLVNAAPLGSFAGSLIGANSGYLVAGIGMVAADLIYRNRRKNPFESTPFFHPKRGRDIMFIPVCILGALVFVIGRPSQSLP